MEHDPGNPSRLPVTRQPRPTPSVNITMGWQAPLAQPLWSAPDKVEIKLHLLCKLEAAQLWSFTFLNFLIALWPPCLEATGHPQPPSDHNDISWGGHQRTHFIDNHELITEISWNYFGFNFDGNHSISSQFCTCHDSWAVVTCAKLRADQIFISNTK